MPIEYTNYLGDKYYLHEGLTKKDRLKYWFSKGVDRNLVEHIPNRFEIYEKPNGMVYLRRIQLKVITDNEINIVKSSISKRLDTKVDVKKNMITIYLSEGGFAVFQALIKEDGVILLKPQIINSRPME